MAVKNTLGMQNNTARHLALSAHPAGRPWYLKPAVWSPIANHPADIPIVHLTKKLLQIEGVKLWGFCVGLNGAYLN